MYLNMTEISTGQSPPTFVGLVFLKEVCNSLSNLFAIKFVDMFLNFVCFVAFCR